MNIPYRINGPKELASRKLLLWPNNPRLKISDFSEVNYTDQQLVKPANQKKIFDLLSRHEDHDVITLINSMCKVGFMREMAPIVMKIGDSDQYLVLEGNRRLTAITTILNDSSLEISEENRTSLEVVPCWIFEHTSKDIPLKAAISRMVAEAHIKGQKAHTKLQRAHMLYDAYEGFLSEKGFSRGFEIDKEVLRETADFFDFPMRELESELSVIRLYKQFVEAYEFEDIPSKCSEKLSWVHKNPRQFKTHFDYDAEMLCLGENGIERFYDIFLASDAAVRNPQSFKQLLTVMRDGEPGDIDVLRDEPHLLAEIERRIKDQKSDSRFLTSLDVIERRLSAMRISDFNKSEKEIEAIRRVVALVHGKLSRLDPDALELSPDATAKPSRFKRPSDIQEALSLEYSQLVKQVIKVVGKRPNASCVKSKVPTILLKEWGIKSRGGPRDAFCEHIELALETMAAEGRVHLYKAKNDRIKV